MSKEDCFHLGVKALIHNEEGKILLLEKHPKNKAGRCWDIPGGRIGKSEPLEAALRREVYEETGLQHLTEVQFFTMVLTDMRIVVPHGDVGLVLAVYLCRVTEDINIILSDEHIHFDWFDPKSVCNLVSPYFPQALIEKILNGR
ncbi:MAG: NUDIX domain-containing protein [Chlamydiota bacterium]